MSVATAARSALLGIAALAAAAIPVGAAPPSPAPPPAPIIARFAGSAAPAIVAADRRGNRLYLHIYNWPNRFLHLDGLAGRVAYAQLLSDASEVKWVGASDNPHFVPPVGQTTLTLDLPVKRPDVIVPVVELVLK